MLEDIDRILVLSGLEAEFISLALVDRGIDFESQTPAQYHRFAQTSILALRTSILQTLKDTTHRDFAFLTADSQLVQWFLGIAEIDKIKAFSKSTSERYSKWASEKTYRYLNESLMSLLAQNPATGEQAPFAQSIGLPEPLKYDQAFFDSTCLKANIHFPVDWVLLRDAMRTLMKATVLIRKRGLKNRMPMEPLDFLSRINTMCMKMTAVRRTKGAKKKRKKILREMKKLQKCVEKHARRHREILQERWQETDLSEAQTYQIIERIDHILELLPKAVEQAHERIIGERLVPNKEKITSLYDEDINIIIRGKSGAPVEFGNKLWIGENIDGFIIDFKLYQDNPSDSHLIGDAIERLEEQDIMIGVAWGDRGLSGKANTKLLSEHGIRDGLCPRDPAVLAEKLTQEEGFREGLKRRAGTEARIGILRNVFLGKQLLCKGFANRELAVSQAVLTHNLWLVARMISAERKRLEELETGAASKARAA